MHKKIFIKILVLLLIQYYTSSCNTTNDTQQMEKQVKEELTKINTLLRDKDYTLEMAKTLYESYYVGLGQTAPPFIAPGEDTAKVKKSSAEEKIATSIAPFYALECSIGVLCERQGGTPAEWLKKIIDNTADSGTILLLNRFANATWKAGQPFRSLDRITRPVFTVANFLSEEEVQKDVDQVKSAAIKVLAAMKDVADSSKEKQLERLKQLLQSETFAYEMARHNDSSYAASQKQTAPDFKSPEQDSSMVEKSVKEEKIATNIAGFYALECGINYFVTLQKRLPSQILDSVKNNTINKDDKVLLLRFANATWKAGQPFRALSRIKRDNMIPASLLSEEEIEKDFVQIKAAAEKLGADLKKQEGN